MTPATATVLLVFGRGVVADRDGYRLSAESAARVDAAVAYVTAHADAFRRAAAARIVCTGGWPHGFPAAACPPAGCREGELMLARARAAGLDRYARLHAESRSRTTLQNLVHTVQDGLLADQAFGPARPLGLVSHPWHLPRVRFLAGKVLGLTGPALLDIPTPGATAGRDRRRERALRAAAHLGYLGVHAPADLLRRERRIATLLGGRRRGHAGGWPARAPGTADGDRPGGRR
ncbi:MULTISPECIES: ElyC/SanA/YdcF family protein [Micromonospora]|uniref:YdcF family protein n=1 Tax=Micromonospora solifontis TaxID=2487138 RepID=A0ABX9WK56_9ACTN|nr:MULTISPECIES: ElyC/SanA/YdcF family protein [Micromonospora]NES13156.1 YdcF family protein [Micromonospora sp. PPF5-17B]NES36279.1 YdcF family protein [Micromonospora solifontis]NES55081.1 YdcF family protein [Micromonospora sp. PPF5-6]RNL99685.1 YdcF family protein [Micromonospora solifontis]